MVAMWVIAYEKVEAAGVGFQGGAENAQLVDSKNR